MPTMTVYSAGDNTPVQVFNNIPKSAVQDVLTGLCDTDSVYVAVPVDNGQKIVYLFRKHVTVVEVRP